ncbi:uncharacterized protein LOC103695893 [Phoenix dactylifera]|uniref:Uncharacterized protein LOC103695893 n=1 Tax=Phoenix dactylifera TaxID=42345 RepID=A0A8B7BFY1_PHODC|nr:uncharacterized protein LOC103695893 [Phoenix dactylifera]
MSRDVRGRSYRRFLLLVAIHLQFISGLGDDPSTSKDATKADAHSNSSSKTGREILYICLGVAGFVIFSIFLFKYWQKKKREEQHARLLRLFEEDDDLELELSLRD